MGAWLKPNLGRRDQRSDSLAAPGTAPVFDAFCGCQPPSGPIVFSLNTEVHSPPLQSRWVFFMGELRTTRWRMSRSMLQIRDERCSPLSR
jgi:hypothetical protein